EEAEDLAARDAKAHMIDRDEIPEALSQIRRLDRNIAGRFRFERWNLHRPVSATLLLRHERDEGGFERARACAFVELLRCSRRKNLAVVHGDQPIELTRLVHVRRGDDDTHVGTRCTDIGDEIPELTTCKRIDAGRGLIEY